MRAARDRAVSAHRSHDPAQRERHAPLRRRHEGGGDQQDEHRGKPHDLERVGHRPDQPPAPCATLPMIETIGRNMAITIVPTTTASTMMSAGSIAAVRPATALSTSSS